MGCFFSNTYLLTMGCFPHTDRRLCGVPVSTLIFEHQPLLSVWGLSCDFAYNRAQNVLILCNVKESNRTLLCPLWLWFSHWSAEALPPTPAPYPYTLPSELWAFFWRANSHEWIVAEPPFSEECVCVCVCMLVLIILTDHIPMVSSCT